MTISAKFSTVCPACGERIQVGARVEWAKGSPARHAVCPAGRSTAPRERAKLDAPRAVVPALAAGAQEVSRRSAGRDEAPMDAGTVTHLRHVAGGGGPDGHYWMVLAGGRRVGMDHDDEREYQIWHHVRPATEEEAAPLAARLVAKTARAALAADLGRASGERVAVSSMPAEAVVIVPQAEGRLISTVERVALVDGAVLHSLHGDPDMLDSYYLYVRRITDADMVARVAAYVAAAGGAA